MQVYNLCSCATETIFSANTGAIYAYYHGIEAAIVLLDLYFIVRVTLIVKGKELFQCFTCKKNDEDTYSDSNVFNRKNYLKL